MQMPARNSRIRDVSPPSARRSFSTSRTISEVGHFVRSAGAAIKRRLWASDDYVVHNGSVLPEPGMRYNGPDQKDNAVYLQSALLEAERVATKLSYTSAELLVDIGSGQGRLPIGLVRRLPTARYLGIDVSRPSVDWCTKHITRRYPTYRFQHIDMVNARYNPDGEPPASDFRLPTAEGSAEVVYLWGVVTNMEPEYLSLYAREIARILGPQGRLFLTANIEADVPRISINPDNYVAFPCRGPLHVVRYERGYFTEVFRRAGLVMTDCAHHAAGNCQSEIYFVKQQC